MRWNAQVYYLLDFVQVWRSLVCCISLLVSHSYPSQSCNTLECPTNHYITLHYFPSRGRLDSPLVLSNFPRHLVWLNMVSVN